MTSMSFDELLPLIFIGLMGVSLLVYVVSDGYDLGVGMLMHRATPEERDTMVASIGPFWDANETWLVLGVGLLLIAFPKAHGLVLSELYLPTALMLVGLILRGAAFDFRVKGKANRKATFNLAAAWRLSEVSILAKAKSLKRFTPRDFWAASTGRSSSLSRRRR